MQEQQIKYIKRSNTLSKFSKVSIFAVVIAIAVGFAFSISPAQAATETFDLYVNHNINGRSLGLDKELPVDVYVNGGYVFTFSFGESASFEGLLEAGEYSISVKLAGTDIEVMSLGPVEIPAGVEVSIRATLGAGKTPTLRAKIK
jgi:CRISPR/Cas system-associated exonuclease Cas4 (RecB family)